MEIKSKTIDTDCGKLLYREIKGSFSRFELEKEDEIKEALQNITKFLESEYKLRDEDIVIYKYKKDGKFIGITYHFRNTDYAIKGQLCIVFTDKKQSYYIFRTAIDCPQTWSIEQYKDFCNNVDKLARELKLERTHVSTYSEPVFYVNSEKVDIDFFKDFIGKIQIIAEHFPLYNPEGNQIYPTFIIRR